MKEIGDEGTNALNHFFFSEIHFKPGHSNQRVVHEAILLSEPEPYSLNPKPQTRTSQSHSRTRSHLTQRA